MQLSMDEVITARLAVQAMIKDMQEKFRGKEELLPYTDFNKLLRLLDRLEGQVR